MKNRDYIIFSSIDWEVHYQLHHQLTLSLSQKGNRVLYVQNIGVRPVNINDTGRIFKRIKDRLFSTKGYKIISKNVSLLIPLIVPLPFNKFFIKINTFLLEKSIENWIAKSSFNNPIIITFLPNPVIVNLMENFFKKNFKIYYCANHMSKGSPQAEPLENWEKKLFNEVNLIFTISNLTNNRSKKYNNESYIFPPAVDYYKILQNNENLKVENHKKNICYIGAISNVMDLNLLDYTIGKLQNYNFIFIGPVLINVNLLKKYKNIIFLGQLTHEQTISYLKKMYIGLIPYKKNEFTDNVYCCKLNEYLACGLPVISTNIYEIELFSKKYNDVIYLSKNKEEFVSNIIKVDNNYLNLDTNYYKEIAKENSWENRFNLIEKTIEKKLIDFEKNTVSKKNNFFDYYKRFQKKVLFALLIPVFILFITFYSPLFWYLGNILSIQTPLSNSQAIVVFSGDGYSTYINTGYQKRALDSKKYLNQKLADRVILSSGRDQTIHEVKLLRSFLLSEGIDNKKIYIFEKYPSSTYENVLMVGNYLQKNNINDIIFITAPYHSLRSSLIWKNNFPGITIKIPRVIDSPSENIEWTSKFSNIKTIIYEFLAIIHNWFNKRL